MRTYIVKSSNSVQNILRKTIKVPRPPCRRHQEKSHKIEILLTHHSITSKKCTSIGIVLLQEMYLEVGKTITFTNYNMYRRSIEYCHISK